MPTIVLLSRFMATASDGATHTLLNFSANVIWNNLVLIYPATIVLIAGYMIDPGTDGPHSEKHSDNPYFLSEDADRKVGCHFPDFLWVVWYRCFFRWLVSI